MIINVGHRILPQQEHEHGHAQRIDIVSRCPRAASFRHRHAELNGLEHDRLVVTGRGRGIFAKYDALAGLIRVEDVVRPNGTMGDPVRRQLAKRRDDRRQDHAGQLELIHRRDFLAEIGHQGIAHGLFEDDGEMPLSVLGPLDDAPVHQAQHRAAHEIADFRQDVTARHHIRIANQGKEVVVAQDAVACHERRRRRRIELLHRRPGHDIVTVVEIDRGQKIESRFGQIVCRSGQFFGRRRRTRGRARRTACAG